MNQIILGHYKNFDIFISLKNFLIPFLANDDGLFYKITEQVFFSKETFNEGISINDKEEGYIIQWYTNGQQESERHYKNGKREGFLISWYDNGNKETIEYYKNGKLEGFSTSWYDNGIKKSMEYYKNGELEGFWISYYKNGQLNASNSRVAIKESEGNFKNGKEEGNWIYWYENGNKQLEEYYKNGILT